MDEFAEDKGILRRHGKRLVDRLPDSRAEAAVFSEEDLHPAHFFLFFFAACSARKFARSS